MATDLRPPQVTKESNWSDFSGFDSESTPYPSIARSSLASISGKYSFVLDYRDWPALTDDPNDSDDELISTKAHRRRSRCNPCSLRGFANIASVGALLGGMIALFVGYPIISALTRGRPSNLGGYNLGGINASGQIPEIRGNFALIDRDTPKMAHRKPSWSNPSVEMQLVFSDEFNTDGRSFYPGDDPYWEAADLHYWATGNLEWYDPEAITTKDGSLVITLSEKQTHGLNYEGGLLSSWNKFCFTGGYIEASVMMPGPNNILGLWPAIWTMGNLGRAGYGASLEGVWPYTYDSCDVGTAPNQTLNGVPVAATENGDPQRGGALSFLPGQRLSRCTCPGEDHPGPKHSDGTFVGRAAPEIDIFEAQIGRTTLIPSVSQSAQWAPFNAGYKWPSTAQNINIVNSTITRVNAFLGSATQQATSAVTNTDPNCYEGSAGCFSVYGFEPKYKPGFDTAYITWVSGGLESWTLKPGAVGADPAVEVSARPISQEPMYIILNLGMSRGFGPVDLAHLPFPAHMKIDYVRVYQPRNAINVGCDPKNFPTAKYINQHIAAYTNPNLTTWVDDYQQPWPKSSLLGQC